MPYSLTVSADRTYIISKFTGEITSELAFQQVTEAHALGDSLGINKYLVDVTEAKSISTAQDDYRLAHVKMKTTPGVHMSARVALLVSPEDHSHDFIETVSKNAGLNTTIFRDRELALQHLKK